MTRNSSSFSCSTSRTEIENPAALRPVVKPPLRQFHRECSQQTGERGACGELRQRTGAASREAELEMAGPDGLGGAVERPGHRQPVKNGTTLDGSIRRPARHATARRPAPASASRRSAAVLSSVTADLVVSAWAVGVPAAPTCASVRSNRLVTARVATRSPVVLVLLGR